MISNSAYQQVTNRGSTVAPLMVFRGALRTSYVGATEFDMPWEVGLKQLGKGYASLIQA